MSWLNFWLWFVVGFIFGLLGMRALRVWRMR